MPTPEDILIQKLREMGLRTPLTTEEYQAAKAEADARYVREQNQQMKELLFIIFVIIALAVILGMFLYRKRRQIAAGADRVAVNAAAAGLRAKRSVGRRWGAFKHRVETRAAETKEYPKNEIDPHSGGG